MKLTPTQTSELQNRIAFAFHARATATMNTAGQIGQTNFYGDAANPTVTQSDVLGIIQCALDNWTQPEGTTAATWLDQVSSDILADVIASEPEPEILRVYKVSEIFADRMIEVSTSDGLIRIALNWDHLLDDLKTVSDTGSEYIDAELKRKTHTNEIEYCLNA